MEKRLYCKWKSYEINRIGKYFFNTGIENNFLRSKKHRHLWGELIDLNLPKLNTFIQM